MASLVERLLKSTTIKETATLEKSIFFKKRDLVQTSIPILNLAQSGELDGGFGSGLTIWAGPSKHFKTSLMLANIKAYLDKYPEAICLFYDSEFGTPQSYFESFGIPLNRIVHTPITDIEVLKFDLIAQLEEIARTDRVFIAVDSVGNLASKKELEDAKDGKSVTDMTRAKSLKGLFRMVTPYLTIKDIPLHVVNHTYQTQEMYSKAVVSGGCLVAGQKIRLADGSFKTIEDFVVGDQVITLDGPKSVTHIWDQETLEFGTPPCYEIEFDDGSIIECSNHHPFLVNGEWVDAEDLEVGVEVESVE